MASLAGMRANLADYRATYRRYVRESDRDGTSEASDDARYDTEQAAIWLAASVADVLRHAPRGKRGRHDAAT
jgi:hypothetical protein